MTTLTGIAASDGIAIGPSFVYRPSKLVYARYATAPPSEELARFNGAIATVEERLQTLEAKTLALASAEEAKIFEIHRMFLADSSFVDPIKQCIQAENFSVEAAVDQTAQNLAAQFRALGDEYFQHRAADIIDLAQQLLRALLDINEVGLAELSEPVIIWADELTPSDMASLKHEMVLGFCTRMGSTTSHMAILARSMGLPAVVGLDVSDIPADTMTILDGTIGTVLLNPNAAMLSEYRAKQEAALADNAEKLQHAHEPAITRDGKQFEIVANIGGVDEAQLAIDNGAEGVGLLRTEFMFLTGNAPPSEEAQYKAYRAIADVFQQLPLIVRTLDVGGDKEVPGIDMPQEQNPFLGYRAIRMTLDRPDLFQAQLRAILRASVDRNVKIMFPMIGSVDELRGALAALDQARASLEAEGTAYNKTMEVGMMMEVPSAALLADVMAPMVDFFSVGTNDLAQYTLAVDRTNEHVAHLADALHPAVIRLLQRIAEAAHAQGKWVGICGELAGDPLATALLVGLGYDELSTGSPRIPTVKHNIRQLTVSAAEAIARHCLTLPDVSSVRAYLTEVCA